MTIDDSLEQIIISSAASGFAAIDQKSNLPENFTVYKWFMSVFYNDPVFRGLFQAFLGFVVDFVVLRRVDKIIRC